MKTCLQHCMEAEDSGYAPYIIIIIIIIVDNGLTPSTCRFDSQRGVPPRWYSSGVGVRFPSPPASVFSIPRSNGCVRSQHPPRGPMDKASAYGRLFIFAPPTPAHVPAHPPDAFPVPLEAIRAHRMRGRAARRRDLRPAPLTRSREEPFLYR